MKLYNTSISSFLNNLLLDPSGVTSLAPSGAGPAFGTSTPGVVRLDTPEADQNVEIEEPAKTEEAFDLEEFTSPGKRATEEDKNNKQLPGNRIKKDFNRSSQKFPDVKKPAEEAAHEEADVNEETPAEEPTEEAETPVEEAASKEVEASKETSAEVPAVKKGRDYTGLDPEVALALKSSNNYHYNKFRPVFDKLTAKAKEADTYKAKAIELEKTLTEKGTPPAWYDHPEAYTLTPEYQELAQTFDRVSFEQEFIKQQLITLKEGGEIRELRGYNKNGDPVFTNPRKPTNADEVNLTSLLHQYSAKDAELRNKVGGLQATFKQQHTFAADQVTSTLKQHVDKLIPELKPVKQEEEMFLNVIPAAFKSHPMSANAATMFSIILRQANMIKGMMEEKQKGARINNDAREAGVNTRTLPKGAGANQPRSGTTKINGKTVPAEFDFERDFKINGD